MTYHANHSWCNNSNWDGKNFDSEVMVYLNDKITRTDILEDTKNNKTKELTNIKNPDYLNITKTKEVFNQKEYDFRKEIIKEHSKTPISDEEIEKHLENVKKHFYNEIDTLKEEVIDWLNKNIKDFDNEDINEKKGWCIGNDDYRSKDYGTITIFFKRELDALKFIRRWSIFKEPVFYFDYFSDDRRNMDLNKIIHIINKYLEENNLEKVNIEKLYLYNRFQGNINLDPLTFSFLDWEKEDEEYDDINLTIEETENFVKSLYENDNIKYEDNNLTEYKEIFILKNTNKISLGYEKEI